MSAGQFPKNIPLGPRCVGWDEQEIIEWQEACLSARLGEPVAA